MKKFFSALIVLIAIAFTANAQDFRPAGGTGCSVTRWDTVVQNNAVVRDTFQTVVNPDRNNVGFEIELSRTSGSGIDTAVVTMWATRIAGGASGWVRLQTFQVADISASQYWMCQYPETRNPYNGYMFTYENMRTAITNEVRWRVHMLIR